MVGNRISETLDFKILWGNMPQTPLVWGAFGAPSFHVVRTPSESHATPLTRTYALTERIIALYSVPFFLDKGKQDGGLNATL